MYVCLKCEKFRISEINSKTLRIGLILDYNKIFLHRRNYAVSHLVMLSLYGPKKEFAAMVYPVSVTSYLTTWNQYRQEITSHVTKQ
jgi:hypothetical protein